MPSSILPPSRSHRLEVKYNVITDFPHLGLHSAAASGDIGLVQYAISHGQPVNSVLDGVLPLHAACAGGNVLVVKFLVENGADVNAPRLPRRYSDRNRDAAAPIVGTSGSTPLHFAGANGHLDIVRILLSYGAIPDRADKHGITPEMIARQNGWIECAEVLSQADKTAKHSGSSCPLENLDSLRKRLHFKRSSDQILSSTGLTSDSESKTHTPQSDQESRPLYPGLGGNASQLSTQTMPPLSSGRRPSLPHVFDDTSIKPPSHSNRSNRPGSAGAGSDSRKLHSKLPLLSLFKKSNADGSSSSVTSISDLHIPSPPPPQPVSLTSSPAHVSNPLPVSPPSIPIPLSSSLRDPSRLDCQRRRLESSRSLTSIRAYPLHPADIQSAITKERSRNRSVSGASSVSLVDDETDGAHSISGGYVKSGILRMHSRSISGQGSVSQPSSVPRTIRFERSASDSTSLSGRTRSPIARGQLENRMRLLGIASGEDEYDRIPDTIEESPVITHAAPSISVNIITDNDDDPDEEYGVPLSHPELNASKDRSPTKLPFSINIPPPIDDVLTEVRLRGDSISSSCTTGSTSTYPPTTSSEVTGSTVAFCVTHSLGRPATPSISAELETDAGETRESNPRPRKIPAPLDFDVSKISSHAQAEALVQRTEQSIMNMEQHLDQHVRRDSETGRTPLSAKLAAYGESLALERRFKGQGQVSPKNGSFVDGGISLLSATKPSVLNSVTSSSSTESTTDDMQYAHSRQTTWPASYDEPRGLPSSPTDLMYSRPRPQTPDLDSEPVSPLPGVPLSRVSTAPSYDSASTRRGRQRDPSWSVQKLTRMGFSTFDNWHPSPLKGRASRSPPPNLRFGLRTIMQSFQGK